MIKYRRRFWEARPANFDGVFDWDFLLPAFAGTKIQPTDIDGMVERYGRILLFETKNPDKDIPLGQRIAFETLLKIGEGKICLMVLYGKTSDTIVKMEEWWYRNGRIDIKPMECNSQYVLERVKAWFQWASSLGL